MCRWVTLQTAGWHSWHSQVEAIEAESPFTQFNTVPSPFHLSPSISTGPEDGKFVPLPITVFIDLTCFAVCSYAAAAASAMTSGHVGVPELALSLPSQVQLAMNCS